MIVSQNHIRSAQLARIDYACMGHHSYSAPPVWCRCSLESSWVFKPGPTPSSTHVDFSVRFEGACMPGLSQYLSRQRSTVWLTDGVWCAVTNPMASAAIDVVFADVVRKQIQAFEDRCTQVRRMAWLCT